MIWLTVVLAFIVGFISGALYMAHYYRNRRRS